LFGLTTLELRQAAFEDAELNNIKNTFNKTQRLAGRDCSNGFLKKNPTLRIWKCVLIE
jgi:hypothetical protein